MPTNRARGDVAVNFKKQPILVCHDNRTSGPLLAHAVASGLMTGGSDVLFDGQVITPAVSFYTRHQKLAGAMLITGSHIPANMSGIEVLGRDGAPVNRAMEKKIEGNIRVPPSPCPWFDQGQFKKFDDIGQFWVNSVLSHVDVEFIRKQKFRVVVDGANGTAIPWLFDLVKELDCTLISVNARLDAFYPGRSPNLRVKLLDHTAKIVRETKSDLGVAVDGDGDRAFFIDEKGRPLMGDVSGSILAQIELERHGGGILVTPINSSNVIEDVAVQNGGQVIYSRVGPPAIVAAVKRHRAIFAFEESGKAIYPKLNYLSDSGLATVNLLQSLAQRNVKLSTLVNALPKYYQLKRAIACPNPLKEKVTNYIKQVVKEQYPEAEVVTMDGVKVIFEDGWLLQRTSGTEPVYRCFAEAQSEKRAKELLQMGLNWVYTVLKQQRDSKD